MTKKVFCNYFVSIFPIIVLPIIIYTNAAQKYAVDSSSLPFTELGLYYIFMLLATSLSSITIFSYLNRKDSTLKIKSNVKFGITSFVILYATLFVYGILTREQYRLSYNTFNEAEAMPIHFILFVTGLSINIGIGIILNKLRIQYHNIRN